MKTPGEGEAGTTVRGPRVRIIIESDAEAPEAVLASVAAEATQAARGRIDVVRADLVIDGVVVEVYRR